MSIKIDKYYRVQYFEYEWRNVTGESHTFEEAKEVYNKCCWWRAEMTSWRFVEISTISKYLDDQNSNLLSQKITQERYLYVSQD